MKDAFLQSGSSPPQFAEAEQQPIAEAVVAIQAICKQRKEEARIANRLAYKFPHLNRYGNYRAEDFHDGTLKLPKRLLRIGCDGTIRKIKKLNIPYREIVTIDEVGGRYFPRVVGYIIPRKYEKELAKSPTPPIKPHPDLILCVREISRAAHRERDEAQQAYQSGRHTLAGNCRRRKEKYYALKDRGIAFLHREGKLHYAGQTSQNLAVYEYGDGGMSCFHSTLHPAEVEPKQVEGHPEILEVEAKEKIRGVSLKRIIHTLESLPDFRSEFQRSAALVRQREPRPIICYECGEMGHVARECPDGDGYYDDYHMLEEAYAENEHYSRARSTQSGTQ